MALNHVGTKELETARLCLRRFRKEDAPEMYKNWASDPLVTKYLSWSTHIDHNETRDILRLWLCDYRKKNFYLWAIVEKETGRLIGSIGLHEFDDKNCRCEVGYCLSREKWNNGFVTEALGRLIEFAFGEIMLERLSAYHHIQNPASGRVMIKAGMKLEAVLRRYFKDAKGNMVDCVSYAIVKDDLTV